MSYFWLEITILAIAYTLGSIPTGIIVSKLFKTPNPRAAGSGNIGTTNMLRTGGTKAAAITFVVDMLKGALAVVIAYSFTPDLYQLAGMISVIGHIFPIWLVFKGGKGIATALGVIIAWDYQIAIACAVTWVAIVATTRYVSVGSIGAVIIAPIATVALNKIVFLEATLVLATLIFISHRGNIGRLITGKEYKIGDKSDKSSK
jgi:glycerol-3-phosphate acyltransferase PlsY